MDDEVESLDIAGILILQEVDSRIFNRKIVQREILARARESCATLTRGFFIGVCNNAKWRYATHISVVDIVALPDHAMMASVKPGNQSTCTVLASGAVVGEL